MAMVMGISDHVVVLDAGRDDRGRHARRSAPRSARAQGLSRRRRDASAAARDAVAAARRMPILSCLKLTAGYGAAPVLDDVDFAGADRARWSRCSAPTAPASPRPMRAVTGLLRPVTGAIVLDDTRIEDLAGAQIAARGSGAGAGRPAGFSGIDRAATTSCSARTRDATSIDEAEHVEALLQRFPRLRERLYQRAGLLSGGEQQMLAIARGLMAKPRILLLDEPSLGLAPADDQRTVRRLLPTLRDEGVTILLVDQMAALALTVADRGYVLESGRIVRDDAAEALAHDPALEAAYLGHAEAAQ